MVKADRLIARRASTGGILDSWPVYRCLVYQVELDDRLFVLSARDWFRVDLDYRRQVEADVDALPRFEGLPDADPDTDEDTYNKKAAKHLDAACLDKRFVYDGGPDKMEVCDVLTREGGFIHVKPRGASSTLSHLFSRGSTALSAEPEDYDHDELTQEAREQAARGEVRSHEQVRSDLLGSY